MASPTYPLTALVLKKTKLSEADLILTLLTQDGSLRQVVAKGARKPTSSFSSRLELFSLVDLLCVQGKSLDIVKEARLVDSHEALRTRVELTYAATPILELLVKVAQPGLANERLYLSTLAALEAMCKGQEAHAPAICAAQMLKILAFEGLRPSLNDCVCCGKKLVETSSRDEGGALTFSMLEGGLVCGLCAGEVETIMVPSAAISWAHYFLHSSYADILAQDVDMGCSFEVLRFCQGLVHAQLSLRLKSLDMLFTCGLF